MVNLLEREPWRAEVGSWNRHLTRGPYLWSFCKHEGISPPRINHIYSVYTLYICVCVYSDHITSLWQPRESPPHLHPKPSQTSIMWNPHFKPNFSTVLANVWGQPLWRRGSAPCLAGHDCRTWPSRISELPLVLGWFPKVSKCLQFHFICVYTYIPCGEPAHGNLWGFPR